MTPPNVDVTGIGRPGVGTRKVDGKVISAQKLERKILLTKPWDETFDIGSDTGTPIDDSDYQVSLAFTGKIDKLTVSIDLPQWTSADKQKFIDAERAAQDAN